MTDAVAEITSILESWAVAVRSHDIDEVLKNHSQDLLMFDVVGPIQLRGLDAYRATWVEQFFPWHGETGRFDIREIAVIAGDTAAFATALLDCGGTEKGQQVAFTLRLTVGFQKRADRWTIVHEHHSEPLPYEGD